MTHYLVLYMGSVRNVAREHALCPTFGCLDIASQPESRDDDDQQEAPPESNMFSSPPTQREDQTEPTDQVHLNIAIPIKVNFLRLHSSEPPQLFVRVRHVSDTEQLVGPTWDLGYRSVMAKCLE